VQDPTIKIPKIDFFPLFLIELEMADLSIFFEKNDLRPLGIKPSYFFLLTTPFWV
jgi:hypothetical protein